MVASVAANRPVLSYVTNGDRLLLLRHVHAPEAGVQVPAGTVEPGESPDEGVLREAQEETGLDGLTIRRFLGARSYNGVPFGLAEVHRRYYYHLEIAGSSPSTWRHFEEQPSGATEPIEFELYWASFPDEVPELASRLGDFLESIELGQ